MFSTPTGSAAGDQGQVKWLQERFDQAHDGFNRFETVLSPENVSSLRIDWTRTAPLDPMGNVLIIGRFVYTVGSGIGSDASTYLIALDRGTGARVWEARQPIGNISLGIAGWGGRVFIPTVGDHMLRAYEGT